MSPSVAGITVSAVLDGTARRLMAPCWRYWEHDVIPTLVGAGQHGLLQWYYRCQSGTYHQQCDLLTGAELGLAWREYDESFRKAREVVSQGPRGCTALVTAHANPQNWPSELGCLRRREMSGSYKVMSCIHNVC